MDILGHIILDSEIIGVSPVVTHINHKEQTFSFSIYTKGSIIPVFVSATRGDYDEVIGKVRAARSKIIEHLST